MTKKIRPGRSAKKRPKRVFAPSETPLQHPAIAEQDATEARAPIQTATASRANGMAQRAARGASPRPSSIPQGYDHVLADLKRIGITSGLMFVIIIALFFAMR